MTLHTELRCDKCNKEILIPREYIQGYNVYLYPDKGINNSPEIQSLTIKAFASGEDFGKGKEIDLCPKCFVEIFSHIKENRLKIDLRNHYNTYGYEKQHYLKEILEEYFDIKLKIFNKTEDDV